MARFWLPLCTAVLMSMYAYSNIFIKRTRRMRRYEIFTAPWIHIHNI